MTVHVTVGEMASQAGVTDARGTITVALAKPSGRPDEESMVEVSAKVQKTTCAVRLTISEAEVLQNALDSLILEAAVPGLGTDSTARDRY